MNFYCDFSAGGSASRSVRKNYCRSNSESVASRRTIKHTCRAGYGSYWWSRRGARAWSRRSGNRSAETPPSPATLTRSSGVWGEGYVTPLVALPTLGMAS